MLSARALVKILSVETKEKIRNSNLGLKRSKETKQRISNCRKGSISSEATKDKIKASNRSVELCCNYIKIYNKYNVLMYETNETFIPFCKKYNLPYRSLIRSHQNGTKLYQAKQSLSLAKKNGNDIFQGWYAVKE